MTTHQFAPNHVLLCDINVQKLKIIEAIEALFLENDNTIFITLEKRVLLLLLKLIFTVVNNDRVDMKNRP